MYYHLVSGPSSDYPRDPESNPVQNLKHAEDWHSCEKAKGASWNKS